jgi:hypothetical protein
MHIYKKKRKKTDAWGKGKGRNIPDAFDLNYQNRNWSLVIDHTRSEWNCFSWSLFWLPHYGNWEVHQVDALWPTVPLTRLMFTLTTQTFEYRLKPERRSKERGKKGNNKKQKLKKKKKKKKEWLRH